MAALTDDTGLTSRLFLAKNGATVMLDLPLSLGHEALKWRENCDEAPNRAGVVYVTAFLSFMLEQMGQQVVDSMRLRGAHEGHRADIDALCQQSPLFQQITQAAAVAAEPSVDHAPPPPPPPPRAAERRQVVPKTSAPSALPSSPAPVRTAARASDARPPPVVRRPPPPTSLPQRRVEEGATHAHHQYPEEPRFSRKRPAEADLENEPEVDRREIKKQGTSSFLQKIFPSFKFSTSN